MGPFVAVFSLFNIVQFKNDPCSSTATLEGYTTYTAFGALKRPMPIFFRSIPFSWRFLFLLGALETATGPASRHQNARIGAGQRRETAQQGACFTSILRNKSAEVLQCGF